MYWVQNVLDRPADSVQAGIPQHTSGEWDVQHQVHQQRQTERACQERHGGGDAFQQRWPGGGPQQCGSADLVSARPVSGTVGDADIHHARPSDGLHNYAEFCALDIRIADPLIGYSSDSSSQVNY